MIADAVPIPSTVSLARVYAGFARLADRLQSLAALAMRLYVAKVFFVSGLLKAQRWDSTLALFENEYHVPLLPPTAAALVGTACELTLPLLLATGLGTRAAALALFAFNIVAATSYPDLSPAGLKDHVLWGALMLLIAVYGPGRLALDRWLGVEPRNRP
jgi:putative oxidoreductase